MDIPYSFITVTVKLESIVELCYFLLEACLWQTIAATHCFGELLPL